jgi:hypothetical protein
MKCRTTLIVILLLAGCASTSPTAPVEESQFLPCDRIAKAYTQAKRGRFSAVYWFDLIWDAEYEKYLQSL